MCLGLSLHPQVREAWHRGGIKGLLVYMRSGWRHRSALDRRDIYAILAPALIVAPMAGFYWLHTLQELKETLLTHGLRAGTADLDYELFLLLEVALGSLEMLLFVRIALGHWAASRLEGRVGGPKGFALHLSCSGRIRLAYLFAAPAVCLCALACLALWELQDPNYLTHMALNTRPFHIGLGILNWFYALLLVPCPKSEPPGPVRVRPPGIAQR